MNPKLVRMACIDGSTTCSIVIGDSFSENKKVDWINIKVTASMQLHSIMLLTCEIVEFLVILNNYYSLHVFDMAFCCIFV